jgi:hypothetical protein
MRLVIDSTPSDVSGFDHRLARPFADIRPSGIDSALPRPPKLKLTVRRAVGNVDEVWMAKKPASRAAGMI